MTIPPDVEAFILSVRTATLGMCADLRVLDTEFQWHKGYLHGVIEGAAIAMGVPHDELAVALLGHEPTQPQR